ncbi:MAG: hypothetical protein ABR978_02295, partial [Dehalococcoidia bacterium]
AGQGKELMAGLAEISLIGFKGVHDGGAYRLLRRSDVTPLELLYRRYEIVPSQPLSDQHVRKQIACLRREASHRDPQHQSLDGVYLHFDQYNGGPKRRKALR